MQKLEPSQLDRQALAGISFQPELDANAAFDYSKAVVKKPWGYEYLIYQNGFAAVWILHIKEGFQTSMHCHLGKKSCIVVLSGDVECSTLENTVAKGPSDTVMIGKQVFHRTKAISEGGAYLMEIETPVNKQDLVRFKDDYGREEMGYESIDHVSFNTQNYNYVSLIDPRVYYNVRKRLGTCSIQLAKISNSDELNGTIKSSQWDVMSILQGTAIDERTKTSFDVGDAIVQDPSDLHPTMRVTEELEAIIIKTADTRVRLADFVISHLKRLDVEDIFFVAGTSSAHLIDAIGRDTEIRSLSLQTEHAATLAAEAYAKLTGKPGVVVLSSGSSCTNSLTGITGAWIDSTPLVVISGQSRPSNLGIPGEPALRQLANKELDIVNIVRPITKYATVVRDPTTIMGELDEAFCRAVQERPGPTWLDVPIDILGMNIDEADLMASSSPELPGGGDGDLEEKVLETLELLKASARPVILAGHGIRAAGAQSEFLELATALSVPVLTSRRGIDLVADEFPLYFGRPGTYGQRRANFIIQNADVLLTIGSRLSFPLIGRNYKAFARAAKKITVDIDPNELSKATIISDVAINADAGKFVRKALECIPEGVSFHRPAWIAQCRLWTARFPRDPAVEDPEEPGVNPYRFVEILAETLGDGAIVMCDGGPALDYAMQVFRTKTDQRVISSPGLEYEGFAFAGAIGAAMGSQGRSIICLCEERGLERHIPELQTIANYQLPIKVFVFNTEGSSSIQRTQLAYFGGRFVGSDNGGIIGSLHMGKLGQACHIPTSLIADRDNLEDRLESVVVADGPVLCEVRVPEGQEIIPRLPLTVTPDGKWTSRPLEDMYPLLDRQEFRENMIIDVIDDN